MSTLATRENAPPGARRRFHFSLASQEALAAYVFLIPFFVLFFIFIGRSILYSVYMSFYDWVVLAKVHHYIGIKNYQELFGDPLWWLALKNTLIFAVFTVIGTTVVALGAAMALVQPIKARTFFRALFYAPSILSVSVVAIIWGWLMDTDFGVINYALRLIGLPKISWLGDANVVLFSLSLVTIWWTFGFPMLIFMAGLQNIPDALYEAARIDGAGNWQLFRFITVPMLRPTILFVTVTGFISHIQVFGQPYIMTNGGGPGQASYTVIIYLYQAAWRYFRVGFGSAVAVAIAVVMVAFTLIQFRFFGREADT
jgi:multiple sugar transport system permease protein